MPLTLSQIGEFGLINRLKRKAGRSPSVIKGIGDDAAVVPLSPGKCLLLTTDTLVQDVHFTKKTPARAVGHKALAVNLSDIAAMGGIPKYAVVSLGVPASCAWHYVSGIYAGMKKTAGKFGVAIVGGDTVRSKAIVITVSMAGEVKKNEAVYRGGAHRGDQVFVTGPLGGSLKTGKHLRFVPRVAQARYLVKTYKPTAMIDISDGLAADLGHILEESRAGAVLEERRIPRHKGVSLNNALYDGEDFELLFTLTAAKARALSSRKRKRFQFYHIGEITDRRKGLQLRTSKGALKKIEMKGYTHF